MVKNFSITPGLLNTQGLNQKRIKLTGAINIQDLDDVNISSIEDGDSLIYNSINNQWQVGKSRTIVDDITLAYNTEGELEVIKEDEFLNYYWIKSDVTLHIPIPKQHITFGGLQVDGKIVLDGKIEIR
jgi:hypothetical protein